MSRGRSADLVVGFAPVAVNLKESIEKQKQCIAWNLRTGTISKNGKVYTVGDSRHALYCTNGDILGFLISKSNDLQII